MASFISYQIEVVWIFPQKGIYKFLSTDFIVLHRFSPVRSLLRGYFCKIVYYDQQAELNFHLLKSTKVKPLEVLVVLGVSKYGFYILWPLTAVFKTFR